MMANRRFIFENAFANPDCDPPIRTFADSVVSLLRRFLARPYRFYPVNKYYLTSHGKKHPYRMGLCFLYCFLVDNSKICLLLQVIKINMICNYPYLLALQLSFLFSYAIEHSWGVTLSLSFFVTLTNTHLCLVLKFCNWLPGFTIMMIIFLPSSSWLDTQYISVINICRIFSLLVYAEILDLLLVMLIHEKELDCMIEKSASKLFFTNEPLSFNFNLFFVVFLITINNVW